MPTTLHYDAQRTFLRGLTARDIAEPLPSFDATTPAAPARDAMLLHGDAVAGVRVDGRMAGWLALEEMEGVEACGDAMHPFAAEAIVDASALLTELVAILQVQSRVWVRLLGQVGGVITRTDLQDPPVRMWLFGLLTSFEMRLAALIEKRFPAGGWEGYLSPTRLEKASELQAERRRRGLETPLLRCTQFADKGQIAARDDALRDAVGFVSRKRADATIKSLERLRNNLAHAQEIIDTDWEVIVRLADNLESFFARGLV